MSSNKLLLKFALRYPGWILLTIILGFSGALFNGVSTTLIVPVLLGLLGQEINFKGGPPIIQKAISIFNDSSGDKNLMLMAGAILLAIILKNIAGYASSLASSHLSRLLVNDIRQEGLKLLLEVDLDYYAKTRVGDLINCISREVSQTAGAIRTSIQMLSTAITILVFVALLISISWPLTLASTTLLLLVALINQYFIQRAKQFGKVLSEVSRAYSTALLEILNGIRLVKATGNEIREYQRLQEIIRQREQADLKSQANFAIIGPINEVTGILTLLAIVGLGRAFFSQQLEALSAILLTYLVVLFRLLPLVGQLNSSRSGFANAAPSVEIVADFLNRDDKPFMASGLVPYTNIQQGIQFENVSFHYPGNEDLVLNQVSLWIPQGTTLALVGASGAGKSTLADLVTRFYDPTAGSILIDGKDLRDYELRSLRKAMGIVSQDTFLFNDSVFNNIAYAKESATEKDVIEAAKRANAYEFIVRLPQGFDTQIGDRGVLLSGGQRQRVAIARALLCDPDILVLDEATSALDSVSERLVQQAIDELSRDRTTLVIAHRLSTVQKAHQIAVMDKGQVVEIGSHDQLLRKGGYYTRLYSLQFAENAQEVIKAAFDETLVKTSYEVRTRLNSVIGSLKFLLDDIVDTPEERSEFTEEAYYSAITLLKTLELLENKAKP